jgi:dCTP deaminase
MILLGSEISKALADGKIVISPYNESQLNPNSYDLRLGHKYLKYNDPILDAAKINSTETYRIPKEGLILMPNELYLMETQEITETDHFVPGIEGRSSIGRLGIDIHATAGFGDIGFKGTWTLEISVKKPVRIYANMRICQVYFMTCSKPEECDLYKGKYINQNMPRPSYIWKEREEWHI